MDGTFKLAPFQMSQLSTIHASVKKSIEYTNIPCVYVLKFLKDEKRYREVNGDIKDLAFKQNVT